MIIYLVPVSPANLLCYFLSGETSECFSGGQFPRQAHCDSQRPKIVSSRAATWPKALGARQISGRQTDRKGPQTGNEEGKRPASSSPLTPDKGLEAFSSLQLSPLSADLPRLVK